MRRVKVSDGKYLCDLLAQGCCARSWHRHTPSREKIVIPEDVSKSSCYRKHGVEGSSKVLGCAQRLVASCWFIDSEYPENTDDGANKGSMDRIISA